MAKSKSTRKGKKGQPRRGRRRQPPAEPPIRLTKDAQLDILGAVLLLLSLFTLLALLSAERGAIFGPLTRFLGRLFGWGVYIVPFFVGATGFYLLVRRFGDRVPRPRPEQIVGVLLLFVVLLTTIHFPVVWLSGLEAMAAADAGHGGGRLGAGLGQALVRGLGGVGAALMLLLLWLLAAFLTFGVSPADMLRGLLALRSRLRRRATPVQLPLPGDLPQPQCERPLPAQAEPRRTAEPPPVRPTVEVVHPYPVAGEGPWQLPPLDAILEPGGSQDLDQEFLRQQTRIIEETLSSLGAPAKVMEVNQGPVVTQFGVEPLFISNHRGQQTRVKVSKITSLADDLALALAAKTIRIQAPIPKKGLVGIEVPNQEISLVALRDIIESEAWEKCESPVRLGLGQDVSGQPLVADLTAMPHLLIAGTTGSGKSVCINAILAALLLQRTPDELKLLMVDPKRVELTPYNGIPHLLVPVVVDVERVVGALQWVLREMDGRYRRFAGVGSRDISDYNERVVPEHPELKRMPYIVVVVDELADLMMLAPQETERAVCRLAQMARATGIHLIIATQRPSVDVVTGLIKANFPARIAFAVASSVDSRVVLDMPGAERLLGRGDMLFMPPDVSEPIRLQGAFVSDDELRRLVMYWKGGRELEPVPTPTSAPAPPAAQPVQPPLPGEISRPTVELEDDLLPDVLAILLAENRASISLLQRRLRIGYTRSARIMDLLAEKGIVGPLPSGGQTREVNRAAAEALLRQAGGE